jgi:nucleolar complex protein 3
LSFLLRLQMRVSKEVQALRDYEQALLKGYQSYLKTLLAAATANPPAKPSPSSSSSPAAAGHSSSSMLATKRVAVRCMGQLLVARPGFNYCSDLLQALVPMMLGPDAQVQGTACDAIRQLLQEDAQVGVTICYYLHPFGCVSASISGLEWPQLNNARLVPYMVPTDAN